MSVILRIFVRNKYMEKTCCKCKDKKDVSEFGIDQSNKDGRTYSCKECRNKALRQARSNSPEKQKERNLRSKDKRKAFYDSEKGRESSRRCHLKIVHGMTLEAYNEMLDKQGGVCAICKQKEQYKRNSSLCVDHCHDSGKIRGLLCNNCNRSIGLLKDNVDILKEAIIYLNKSKDYV